MADDFTERYQDLLTGWYDCVDRIVLNAYYPMGNTAGGFRTWWRRLIGGSESGGFDKGRWPVRCLGDRAGF
jgi:hypothetical protein